jgi:RNA polymerase sigma factor (sigma-70 family)
VSAEHDAWLFRRAAAGDEAAFEQLLQRTAAKLRNVAQTFLGVDTQLDDLVQIILVKLWQEARRGAFNPHRAPFERYVSTIAHQALRDDKLRRHAQQRRPAQPPVSLDVAHDDAAWIAPSWHHGVDPLRVVLERERLRLAWESLSEGRQRDINRWLNAAGGVRPGGLTASQITCAASARKAARAVLDELA